MLEKERPDVVFVCIPPGAHSSQVADAARAGAALFVAKPVALDAEAAHRAREAIEQAGVLNQVGYMARYSDITARARELVAGRTLGMGVGRFMCRMGATHPWWGKAAISGGQMLEQSTHVFDLLRYFLGEVTEVQAFGHRGLAPDVADFPECTVCNLRFASGAAGSIVSTCAAKVEDGFDAELIGANLHLRLVMDTRLRGTIDGEAVRFDGEEAGYFRQIAEFLQAVEARDQTRVRSSYADAVKTLAVTLAANRSLETGRVEPATV
jgi:predicted dehydrogenase